MTGFSKIHYHYAFSRMRSSSPKPIGQVILDMQARISNPERFLDKAHWNYRAKSIHDPNNPVYTNRVIDRERIGINILKNCLPEPVLPPGYEFLEYEESLNWVGERTTFIYKITDGKDHEQELTRLLKYLIVYYGL